MNKIIACVVGARPNFMKMAPLMEHIQSALIPRDATEHADAVIEIRAGAGGDDDSAGFHGS